MKSLKRSIGLILAILSITSLFAFSLSAREVEHHHDYYAVEFDIRDADFEAQVRVLIPDFDAAAFIDELPDGHGYIVAFNVLCNICNAGTFRTVLLGTGAWVRTGHTQTVGTVTHFREIRDRVYAQTCSFCGSMAGSWTSIETRYVR